MSVIGELTVPITLADLLVKARLNVVDQERKRLLLGDLSLEVLAKGFVAFNEVKANLFAFLGAFHHAEVLGRVKSDVMVNLSRGTKPSRYLLGNDPVVSPFLKAELVNTFGYPVAVLGFGLKGLMNSTSDDDLDVVLND